MPLLELLEEEPCELLFWVFFLRFFSACSAVSCAAASSSGVASDFASTAARLFFAAVNAAALDAV